MWNWLKNLWNSAKNLVSKIFEAFVDWILELIEIVYIGFITSLILTYFAYVYLLYVIFYVLDGQTVMEIWNPQESQPKSKVVEFDKAPSGVTKPNREQAEVLKATRK